MYAFSHPVLDKKCCPDSLALIAVYGSVATGEEHEKSDLDLLILIEDEQGKINKSIQSVDGEILSISQFTFNLCF